VLGGTFLERYLVISIKDLRKFSILTDSRNKGANSQRCVQKKKAGPVVLGGTAETASKCSGNGRG
jgi:hypothetical protein